MTKNMTKAQMAEMIAKLSEELEALKAQNTAPVESAKPSKKASKTAKATAPAESKTATLPVRKGKTVSFSGWLNHKVWVFNKALMTECGGEYDRESRTIGFPSAKQAEKFCAGFVPVLTDAQYAESRKAIDDGFKARAAEKVAASEAKTSTKSAAKKSGLIAKSAKASKGASVAPVKKPEWRERAEKGEKPYANYSTYKEYWHACIGK